MESLYRKYRPQTFADVVGQQHVVGTLEHAVLENRTSHAYLFCGPRGTGKTTMARLLAKALMCEQGPGHLPDGTCEQCELIAAGDHPDVYELDAASRTGVDNVREEIINSVGYAPTRGRYKLYIIDEVHMLTTAAFNALLKTLEEPPDHVVFVLCTTDPQKIPATILSRVQRFDFRPIGNDDIRRHLAYVCEQEGFTYEDAAIDLVTANARGGMRDALSTLEQLSVFGNGVIGLEAAQDLLGAVSGSSLVRVMDALARRDVPALFEQVGGMVNAGRDLLQFTRELAAHVRDVYVVAAVGANPAVLPAGSDVDRLQQEATALGSVDRLSRMLLLLGDVSKEMGTAPNQRLALEIAFTRMARPEVDLTLESLAERVEELELKLARVGIASPQVQAAPVPGASQPTPAQQPAAQAAPQSQPAPRPQTRQEPAAQPVRTSQPTPEPAPHASHQPQRAAEPARQVESAPQPVRERPSRPASEQVPRPAQEQQQRRDVQRSASQQRPAARPKPAAQPTQASASPQTTPAQSQRAPQGNAQPVPNPGALQRAWRQVVGDLMARIPARGTLLSNAVATSDNGDELVVTLPKGSSFALKMLERPDIRLVVERSVLQVFGPRTLVFKEGGDAPSNTSRTSPQQAAQRSRAPQPSRFGQTNAPAYTTQPSPYAGQTRASAIPAATPYVPTVQGAADQGAPSNAQPDYPLPWDNPAPSPSQQQPAPVPVAEPAPDAVSAPAYDEPYYEAVPYEELGTFAQDADAEEYAYDPAPVAQPQPAPSSPQPAPKASQPAPASPRPAPEPPQPAPSPQPAPAQEEAAPAPVDVLVGPDELPPELARILEDAFEVFGSGVRASRQS